MHNNRLNGSIPLELENLTNLRHLSLSRNNLTGCIPEKLTKVPNNDLSWYGRAACGTAITVASDPGDRRALVALYNATDGENWKHSISWLSDAPIGEWYGVTVDTGGKVVALDLSYNNLNGKIPSELGSLSHLVTLELSRNRLAGEIPREMGNLSTLFKLSLGDNQLIGEIPSELGSLMALEELMLYFNQLSGDLPATLSKLKNLNAIYLFGNQLSGEIPATLGASPT